MWCCIECILFKSHLLPLRGQSSLGYMYIIYHLKFIFKGLAKISVLVLCLYISVFEFLKKTAFKKHVIWVVLWVVYLCTGWTHLLLPVKYSSVLTDLCTVREKPVSSRAVEARGLLWKDNLQRDKKTYQWQELTAKWNSQLARLVLWCQHEDLHVEWKVIKTNKNRLEGTYHLKTQSRTETRSAIKARRLPDWRKYNPFR